MSFLRVRPGRLGGARQVLYSSGGDVVTRHTAVRDLVYELARRADVDPRLERAGVLADPGLYVELRRPADVLVTMARRAGPTEPAVGPSEWLALDIKVINAEGPDHDTVGARPDAQMAMAHYAAKACALNRTAELCLAHGVAYTPMVFTAQGGRSLASDNVLKRLAALAATREGSQADEVFLASCAAISRRLAIQAARSHVRRCRRAPPRAAAAPDVRLIHCAAARRVAADDGYSDDERSLMSDGDRYAAWGPPEDGLAPSPAPGGADADMGVAVCPRGLAPLDARLIPGPPPDRGGPRAPPLAPLGDTVCARALPAPWAPSLRQPLGSAAPITPRLRPEAAHGGGPAPLRPRWGAALDPAPCPGALPSTWAPPRRGAPPRVPGLSPCDPSRPL